MREFTRQQWLDLKPEIYLADGYIDQNGQLRTDFLADYTTAATTQLLAREVAPQELAFTFEAIRLLLPEQEGPPPERLYHAMKEALQVVARAIRQENNGGLVNWLNDCAAAVRNQADLDGFLAHVRAVMRRYAITAAVAPDGSGSSPLEF